MSEKGDKKDILGRTYEYCLSMFAETEGKKGFVFPLKVFYTGDMVVAPWVIPLPPILPFPLPTIRKGI